MGRRYEASHTFLTSAAEVLVLGLPITALLVLLALVLLALLTLLARTHVAFGLLLSALDLAVELSACLVLYVLRSLVQALVHDVGVIVGEILRFVHPVWHGSPFPPVAPLVDVFTLAAGTCGGRRGLRPAARAIPGSPR